MSYIDLKTYQKSDKSIDDLIDFMSYVNLMGYDAVAKEAWDECSFKLMRHETCDCSIGTVDIWSYNFNLDDGYFEMLSYRPADGSSDYNACWYMLRNNKTVYGSSEFIKFPEDQKDWFLKHFSQFIKEYYEQKSRRSNEDATNMERNSNIS